MALLQGSGVFGRYLTGYMLVAVVDMSYTVSVISAQLSMADTPLFEPNCIRYAVSALMSLVLIVILCQSLAIERGDLPMIFIIGIADYIYSNCYYIAAVFMPVGNLEGIFVSMWIICTTMVDIFRQRIHTQAIVSAIMASIGIFLMTEPWRNHTYAFDILPEAPCKSMTLQLMENISNDATIKTNHTAYTYFEESAYDNQTTNITQISSHVTAQNATVIYSQPMGLYMDIETNENVVIVGYMLVSVSAVCATISSNTAQSLMATYPVATLTFWTSVFEGLLSVILTFAFQTSPGYGGWEMPTATYCLIFTLMYTIFGALMNISSYYTYHFLPVSQVAILLSFTILLLYICQRTVLFNDGNANIAEVMGVCCTLTGSLLTPIFSLCNKKSKYEELG